MGEENIQMDNKKEIIGNLDKGFELLLVLTTIISGSIAQFISGKENIELPPIIENLSRLSIIFIFPVIFLIISWVSTYFIDDENKKMHLRTYSWSLIITIIALEIIELYVLCRPENYPVWLDVIVIIPVFFVLLFPLLQFWLITKIHEKYRAELSNITFFSKLGKLGFLIRNFGVILASVTFWCFFMLVTFV